MIVDGLLVIGDENSFREYLGTAKQFTQDDELGDSADSSGFGFEFNTITVEGYRYPNDKEITTTLKYNQPTITLNYTVEDKVKFEAHAKAHTLLYYGSFTDNEDESLLVEGYKVQIAKVEKTYSNKSVAQIKLTLTVIEAVTDLVEPTI